jgi:hypothetical protein
MYYPIPASEQNLTNQTAVLIHQHLHPGDDHIPHNIYAVQFSEALSFSLTKVSAVSWLLVIPSK